MAGAVAALHGAARHCARSDAVAHPSSSARPAVLHLTAALLLAGAPHPPTALHRIAPPPSLHTPPCIPLPCAQEGTLFSTALVNALYFKGRWAQPFNPSRTISAPFRTSGGGGGSGSAGSSPGREAMEVDGPEAGPVKMVKLMSATFERAGRIKVGVGGWAGGMDGQVLRAWGRGGQGPYGWAHSMWHARWLHPCCQSARTAPAAPIHVHAHTWNRCWRRPGCSGPRCCPTPPPQVCWEVYAGEGRQQLCSCAHARLEPADPAPCLPHTPCSCPTPHGAGADNSSLFNALVALPDALGPEGLAATLRALAQVRCTCALAPPSAQRMQACSGCSHRVQAHANVCLAPFRTSRRAAAAAAASTACR